MKNYLFVFMIIATALMSCEKEDDNNDTNSDTLTVSMGTGYANEVFYSIADGTVKSEPRNNWDLGFMTDPMSSTIIINEGLGIKLYRYSENPDDFNELDTTGMNWNALYNSDTSWTYGAFDRESKGHPDYGWGVYNQLSHNVEGTDVYVLALTGGEYKKLLIETRRAADNTFVIKYADLDQGDAEAVTQEIACGDYVAKNFIYFSFATENVVDREPDSDQWDLLFTQYHDESIPYIVTGILQNMGIEAAEMRNVPVVDAKVADASFNTDINIIGSDWKAFDMGTFSYVIEDELSYFVKAQNGHTYQIVFTGTDGSATGTFEFVTQQVD